MSERWRKRRCGDARKTITASWRKVREGIFREELDTPVAIDLPEDEMFTTSSTTLTWRSATMPWPECMVSRRGRNLWPGG